MSMLLAINGKYNGKVVAYQQDSTSFVGNNGEYFCDYLRIEMDDFKEPIYAQFCSQIKGGPVACKVGDLINFKVKSLSKQQYTIEKIVLPKANDKFIAGAAPEGSTYHNEPEEVKMKLPNNTALSIASHSINAAVNYHSKKAVPIEDVLLTAEKIQKWIKSQNK